MKRPPSNRFLAFLLACAATAAVVVPARAMSLVREITYSDAATAELGVTGRGVAVALLDRGIDWRNADFRNDDGTTRIAYIFDLTDDTGAHAANNAYGVGTVYTRQQIDDALASGGALATRDAVGHGTATAAIAAGNGRNLASRRYRGVAPEATLLVVKVTGGAPAHDDQPAEPAYYNAARLPVAIDFVRVKARELGLPVVMLLNLGSQGGPTDGTSSLCRKIDATVGAGKPGIVFVTGPGDEGGAANRAGGVVAEGETASIRIQKSAAGPLVFDLWYADDDRFDVTVGGPSGTGGPFVAPATESDSSVTSGPGFACYHLGASVDFYGAENGKRELYVQLTGPAGEYTIDLFGRSVANGRFDATINPSGYTGAASGNRFLTYVAPGAIWDGATAFNNLCPSNYVFRTSWTDVDGIARSDTNGGAVGDIWRGSSAGPTFDGRDGIDVVAPGNTLFTTYAPTSYYATFRFNLVDGGEGYYGIANAVSAAAPVVTGIVALMLEANPDLDAVEIRERLRRTARADAFTGEVPNATWGYGKVDAFGAVALSLPGAAPTLASAKVSLANGKLTITGSGFASEVEVYVDGIPFAAPPKLKGGTKLVQKGALANGMRLDAYLQSRPTASIVVRNASAGAAELFYRRP
jgi:hypothetical protein